MLRVDREPGTDLLFAGFLEKELAKIKVDPTVFISVEPMYGNIHFCQDYSLVFQEGRQKPNYLFYALPSYRDRHEELMGEKCALVTYAADPEFHKPVSVSKIYDVGFIGRGYYQGRNDCLDAIGKNFSLLNLSDVPGSDIPSALSSCKILFNHTRDIIDVNLRFFESMALGCQVMLRTDYLKEFAVEGTHYMGYSTVDELLETIKKLLDNENEIKRITNNARSHFLSNHTYAHRALSIYNHLKEANICSPQ